MIEILIFGMATWRIASMLVNEDGPWYVFLELRKRVGIAYDDLGQIDSIRENLPASILSCVWCCSVWIAFGWGLAYLLSPIVVLKIATALSFSTVAIVIDNLLSRR